jgi:hypothetical protein
VTLSAKQDILSMPQTKLARKCAIQIAPALAQSADPGNATRLANQDSHLIQYQKLASPVTPNVDQLGVQLKDLQNVNKAAA